jgi:two-component system NtrC family sensor kinase
MSALPPAVQTDLSEENARLRDELRAAGDRQAAGAEILRAIAGAPGDAEHSLQRIAEITERLFAASSVSLLIADGERWGRTIGVGAGSERIAAAIPLAHVAITPQFMPGAVYLENRQVHVSDIDDPAAMARWPGLAPARAAGSRTMAGTPLRREGRAIGALIVHRDRPVPFMEDELALLQSFADQAAIATENARLFNETKEALERQTATAEILKVIASSPNDVQPVFDVIVESAVRLCGARMGRVYRYEDGVIHMVAGHGLSAPGLSTVQQVFPRPAADDTTAGRAIRSRRPYFVTDIENDESVPALSRQMIEALGTRSQVTVPMLRTGDPIGAITVGWADPGAYGDQQVALLQTFADQAVIAIENVRLFNETREALERQTATADILKVIASSPSDVQPVFEAIAASAKRLIGGFSATVVRFVGDALHLVAFTPTNARADEALQASFPMPLAGFSAFELVRGGETVQFTDTESEDVPPVNREMARLRGYRSMVFTPLMSSGTPIGMISVTRKEPGSFSAHYVQLLQTFADQAVIAIENVRLFDEVQARTADLSESLQQQTAVGDVLKTISRSTFDLQPVLDTLVQTAAQLCDAEMAFIMRREGDVYRAGAAIGYSDQYIEFLRNHPLKVDRGTITGRAVLERRTVQILDTATDPEYKLPESTTLGNQHTALCVPLLRESEPIGTIVLARQRVEPFTQKQIDLVTTFADQAVIAIENVRLFKQLEARTRELSQSLDDLRTAQGRLVQTEKLASLGQLTAGIAHEIKNPLNFVNNFAALCAELTDELNDMLKSAALGEKMREEADELTGLLKANLEKVVQHGKRADSIVKNMLLHSREGSGEHRPADINALLDESLNLAYHGARAEKPQFNVTLQRDFDEMAGTIEVFPQEITRVFLNLISNGFYAVTRRKMEIGHSDFDPTVSATTRNLGHAVEIRIRDNGTGIPAEVKEKMFNPFFTTKPAGEGTGLGLSMSHDIIVKQHGGRIDVDTEPGHFTEFRIVLPRTSNLSNKTRG